MHLQRAAVRSCDPPSWPSAAVAVALENLQWGTQSGALLVGTVSTRTCSIRRCARVIHRLDRRLRWYRRTCTLRRGCRERGDVRTASRARALWMLSSVAGPAVRCGVAPVVDNTLQRARPMQTAVMCACNGPQRADPQAPLPVQRSAAQRSAAPCSCVGDGI